MSQLRGARSAATTLLALSLMAAVGTSAGSDCSRMHALPPDVHESPQLGVAAVDGGALTREGWLERVRQGKPLVITNVTEGWPAARLWASEKYLKRKAGHHRLSPEVRPLAADLAANVQF